MTETNSAAAVTSDEPGAVRLAGWWKFDEGTGATADDSTGNGHRLTAIGNPQWTEGPTGGAIALDGTTQWLSGTTPVVASDRSFSVAAWVRLDSATIGAEAQLKPGDFAVTAVSMDGPSHSPFYLGARIGDADPASTDPKLRWCFTAAPVDGGPTGPVEWQKAWSAQPVGPAELDRWELLVGVYDLESAAVRIFVPGTGDHGVGELPGNWPAWRAEGGVGIGQARYLDAVADQWPGSVGAVRIYLGVLDEADARRLYEEDLAAQR